MLPEHSENNFTLAVEMLRSSGKKIYFCGIGGVSMSALAEALIGRFSVFGSDRTRSPVTDRLIALGADIVCSQSGEHIRRVCPDLFVYSLAIDTENPDYKAAKELSVPMLSRAELLGALLLEYPNSITVSGSHGKSTVTSMLYALFCGAGKRPALFIGAPLADGRTYIAGVDTAIAEACEYRDSFHKLSPGLAVMLNLELDHTDYFRDIAALRASFLKAADRAKQVLLNIDDENLRRIAPDIKSLVFSFGERAEADFRINAVEGNLGKYSFSLSYHGESLGRFSLSVPGGFNVHNAAAAISAAYLSGIEPKKVSEALSSFIGIPRRLEQIAELGSSAVFYDYAHHPTEIRASVQAVREMGHSRIGVIFCPHTYTRTASLFRELVEALSLADAVAITDIYAAREEPIPGVTSERLARACRECGAFCYYKKDLAALDLVMQKDPDAILLMGAGSLEKIKNFILKS